MGTRTSGPRVVGSSSREVSREEVPSQVSEGVGLKKEGELGFRFRLRV